jgi:hypothetical protein
MFIALLILHDFNHGEVWREYVGKNKSNDELIELAEAEDALHKRKVEVYEDLEFDEVDDDWEDFLDGLYEIDISYHEI